MNQMCWWKAGITFYICSVVGKTPPSSSATTQPLPETPVLTRSASQTPPAGVTATTSAASTVSAPSAATGSPVKKQRPLLPKETAPAVQRVVWNSSNKFQTSSQKWHMQKVQRQQQQQQSQQSQSQQPQSSQGTRYQTRQAVKGTHFSNSNMPVVPEFPSSDACAPRVPSQFFCINKISKCASTLISVSSIKVTHYTCSFWCVFRIVYFILMTKKLCVCMNIFAFHSHNRLEGWTE